MFFQLSFLQMVKIEQAILPPRLRSSPKGASYYMGTYVQFWVTKNVPQVRLESESESKCN